ncbi:MULTISPECIES: FAD-dependent monooxygenase [Rhodococcus]|uniref:Putative polyketide hydroxylase n=1 Tax=Rhodococcus jostii TaxID=132919 RepID=A0A1H4JEH5_RHOJO|nr:FAD-dependent monooxygenase [Rhodococcus jostii]SEB43962.1 putative polyketide hydroxylase [Rhodococcus jostii]
MTSTIDVPVLIVGGGPAGMSLALQLDRLGIRSMLAERRPTTTKHPKAFGCQARTMEHFRVWGIEDRVRAAGLPATADVVCWCESLSGPLVAYTHPEATLNTPAPKSIVSQDAVEEALDAALGTSPAANIRRSTELVSFEQDVDGVSARLRSVETAEEVLVRAQYLVGCDGADSVVRDRLGVEMDGPETIALWASHYYRADLSRLPHVRSAIGFLVRPSDPSRPHIDVLASGPDADRWRFLEKLKEGQEPLTEQQLIALVRDYWEIPDLKVELINVMPWRMSAQVAKEFRRGRVFLAGDAAHRFPVTGGMGLNSGIQDVHNLAWKLAMVLDGQAEEMLLDTYEAERRPVAQDNTEWSVGNFRRMQEMDVAFQNRREDPRTWRDLLVDMDEQINCEGQSLGYIYADGALIDDGSPMPEHEAQYYWPTDRPGARFPHIWIDADQTESTIDWFDTSFVLVCGPGAQGWARAGTALATELDLALEIKQLTALLGPLTIERDGAVLVRPDGYVAWRATGPGDPGELRDALERVVAGGTLARELLETS